MDILNDKKIQVSTAEILPNRKFFNQVENQFINGAAKNRLNASEFESMKSRFLESADAKLILYTLNYQNSNNKERIIIVTEETEVSNDNKGFKKIPAICGILQLETLTLPNLLILYNGINIEYQ